MKKRLQLLRTTFFLLFISNIFASKTDEFKFSIPLKFSTQKKQIARVILNYDLLSNLQASNLADLRLFDSEEKEVPYVVYDSIANSRKSDFQFKFLSYTENNNISEIIIENIQQKNFNNLFFYIPTKNFEKHVTILQSNDQKSWLKQGENIIFDYSLRLPLRKTKIKLSNTISARYIKLILKSSDNFISSKNLNLSVDELSITLKRVNLKNFKISNIQGINDNQITNADIYDTVILPDILPTQLKDNNTEITLPRFHFSIEQLVLNIKDSYFYRDIKIFKQKDSNSIYQFSSNDRIYNMPEVNNNKYQINLQHMNNCSVKINIINRNNPVLLIDQVSLKWKKKNLFFFPQQNMNYRLYFGNKNAIKPNYEVGKLLSFSDIKLFEYPTLELREIEENKDFNPQMSKSAKEKIMRWCFSILIISISVVLGHWLFSLVKKLE